VTDRYELEWRPAARKALARLDRPIRIRVLRKVDALADEPRPPGVTKLAGPSDLWRIRIGDYRVVYSIVDNRLIVTVVHVASRGSVYRDL
jgi:mRNA interferase RelE/StbE